MKISHFVLALALLLVPIQICHAKDPVRVAQATAIPAPTIWDAAKSGDLGLVKQLLAARPEMLTLTPTGGEKYSTPLEMAAWGGQFEVFQYLLSKGAQFDKETILYPAASGGNLELLRFLVGKGANVNARTYFTPLSAALGNVRVLNYLLAVGGDVTAKNVNGMTPFEQAIYNWKVEGAKILIEKGVDTKAKTSALMATVQRRAFGTEQEKTRLELIKVLVDAGADVRFKDGFGKTADQYLDDPAAKQVIQDAQKAAAAEIKPVSLDVRAIIAEQMEIQPGEIALEGEVDEVGATSAVLAAGQFYLPSGKYGTIKPVKPKQIIITDETSMQMLGKTGQKTLGQISTRNATWRVVGKDEGSGKPLTARRIVMLSF